MKIRLSKQEVAPFLLQSQAGMTLVEVVIALAITGIMVAGIVSGYVFCSTSTVKDSLYAAANAKASQRLEETRAAIWAPYRATPVDELVATNFLDEPVTLDLSATGAQPTMATVSTTISQISDSPPVRRIRVDCIWQFKDQNITNTIETLRAPDQ